VARRLLALALLLTLSRPLVGQQPDSTGRAPFPAARLAFPERLEGLREPRAMQAPWAAAPRLPPALRIAQYDSVLAQMLDSARAARAVGLRNLLLYGIPPTSPEAEANLEEGPEARNPLGLSKRYADLGLEGAVRLEIRTDRLRNERCTPLQLLDPGSGCRGGFRAPRLDNHVALRSGGLIGQRLHLNVDFDNDRDFDANNDLQVYYEGLEDEIVQRVEVGTVNFLPPRSRFITSAVPSNNFGVNARFEVGAFQIQTLAATQKGSQVAERTFTIGQTTSQAQDRQLRDLDFESGRFYWVVDPTGIPGYPALDILNAANLPVSASTKPAQVRVYRFRPFTGTNGTNPNLGGITATARTIDPTQSYGPVQWELLIQNVDYYLDPSGLWLALTTKLDPDSYLAVSYITGDGTTVGSFPGTDKGPNSTDSLRLVVQPRAGTSSPTFRHEMRQIYRVAGTDLDPSSLEVDVSLNRSERPQSGADTYLALLGLSLPADPNLFDRDNRLFPRTRDPEATQVVRESYIVYPHLQPFADATRLTPAERADSMYRTPLYLLLTETGSKFVQRLRYNSTGSGDRSSLSLGQLQIREGSEQLEVRGRRLEKGVDYTIDYEVGQITFLNPAALFGEGTAQVRARYEVQELFAIAPTTVLGMATTYRLGELGAVNLIGLYQAEQSAFNRPPLGFEASANLVGGINTELHFKPSGITSFLNGLMPRRSTAPSLIDVNGEFAFTNPDPNRTGQAYLEEFEAEAGVQISLGEQAWGFSSQPHSAEGVDTIAGFAGGFPRDDAVALTWQNLVRNAAGRAVELRPQDIDTLIRITRSNDQRETALFFTLHADTAGGVVERNQDSRWTLPRRDFAPRWRSIVTALSTTGVDLSTDEYLEFWVFNPGSRTTDSAGVRLVFDLGNVDEDAVAFAPDSFTTAGTDTTFSGRQYVGVDQLDTERRSVGTFDAQVDDIGILSDRPRDVVNATSGQTLDDLPLCERTLATAVPVFPWGDLGSRCTRGNGVLDAEDLNGDNGLNSAGSNENVFRYVVPLQPGSPYYVRDGVRSVDTLGRVSKWELYRVPVRTPTAVIGAPTLRSIQQMRLTVVAPPDQGQPDVVARWAMARLHFVGTSWVRRAETPIAGLSGSLGNPTGDVIASIVSTANQSDLGYESPPGVAEQVQRRGDVVAGGVQINERSLRVVAHGMNTGDRAEAFLRFPAGPQNMLAYRQLRFWARGRGAGWEDRELQAFIKVGSDDRNFYLYRSPARTTTWEPEMVVDLEIWRRLRAVVEQRWLSGAPPSGATECGTNDPNAYVACQGPYLVHLGDPGINPPNLAAAQELSAGIYKVAGSGVADESELWIDDIRLASPLSETGTAVAFDTRLVASDVGSVSASFTRQDGQFRLMNSDPTYRTTDALTLDSRWQLDRFLPTGLGISAPVSVTYARSRITPQLLTGTDLRGDALPGLREPENWSATYAFALRRSAKGTTWLARSLVDPLSLTAAYTHGSAVTEYSSARSSNMNLGLGYNIQMRRRGFRLPLGWLVPSFLRQSEAGKALQAGSVSLVPSNLRFNSALTRDWAVQQAFAVPIVRSTDGSVRPALALTHLWRNSGGFSWQPLGLLNLASDLTSTRDLRVYPDSSSIGRLAYDERRFLLGVPVGVERDRVLTTSLSSTPRITSWLALRVVSGSNFVLSRSLNSRDPVREDGDTGQFILPQTLNNLRSWETGFTFDLPRILRGISGDSGGIARALNRVRPFDVTRRVQRNSTFDLAGFNPSLGYMLGLGGLARFLEQNGTDALGASVTRTTNVTSGADLPYGLSASLTYGHTSTDRYQLVNQTRVLTVIEQREWPVGNVRFNRVFQGGPLTLFSAGLAFRHRDGGSIQAGVTEGGVQSAINSDSWRPDLQIGLRNGMNFSLSWSTLAQETQNTSSTTVLDQDELAGTFTHSFRLPASLGRSRRQVRSSLSALLSTVRSCLEREGGLECTTISDVIRRELRGGLDTDVVSSLTAGLQVGYSINESRHLNQRTSQISVLASFQWSFDTGGNR
jgi:hypothetical protein